MTINELMDELQKLQSDGLGDFEVRLEIGDDDDYPLNSVSSFLGLEIIYLEY